MATPEQITQVRIELSDTDISFPIMSDAEYQYFLDKNSGSTRRAAMDAAKTIMLKLSMRSDSTVDIFSIKGSAAANAYRQALALYIKNPDLNSLLQNVQGYAGGISIDDMNQNNANLDNNISINPTESISRLPTGFFGV